jgi:hypothetical protein
MTDMRVSRSVTQVTRARQQLRDPTAMEMRLLLARLLLLAAATAGTPLTAATTGGGPLSLSLARVTAAPAAAPDARGGCDEGQLKRDAAAALAAHFDVELGAVAAGDPAHVGFQHLVRLRALCYLLYAGGGAC